MIAIRDAKLVVFCSLAVLATGCRESHDEAGWWQGEQERIELSQRLELSRFRLDQSYSKDFEELQKVQAEVKKASSSLVALRQRKRAVQGDFAALELECKDFKVHAIQEQRQKALGKTFGQLALGSGRSFQSVTVSEIDDAGVTIRHADGSAKLRYNDLDPSQRVFFGLDGDLALAAEKKETANTAAYERWIDDRLASDLDRKERDAETAKREEKFAASERRSAARREAAAMASVAAVRPLGQTATSLSSGSSSYSSYRNSYRPTYRYVYHDTIPSYSYNRCRSAVPFRNNEPSQYYDAPKKQSRRNTFADTTVPSIP